MVKVRVNLSVDEAVLNEARSLKLNLSQLLEERLLERNREARAQRWLDENREAIKTYNARIERDGLWNKDLISF